MEVKTKLRHIYRWEHFWLCIMLLVTLAMHLSVITSPNELLFDEQHYVKDARNIISGMGTERLEHPPLGKMLITTGMVLFGDNPWGWRLISVIFGTVCIALFYFLCRSLVMSRNATLIATFLLAFDSMTFTHASIAMLDIFILPFMIGSFLLYFRMQYISSGIAIGLAALSKLNGALALPALGIYWLFSRVRSLSWKFWLTAVLSIASFLVIMPAIDYSISGKLSNPVERIQTMLSLSGSLTFETAKHGAMSRPWEWLLTFRPMAYWYTPPYTASISPPMWVLIIPTFAYMVYVAIKRKDDAGLFGSGWFVSNFLIWIPLSILTNRISFIYYFLPVIGSLCIGLGLGFGELLDRFKAGKGKWWARGGVSFFLLLQFASFVLLTPVFLRWYWYGPFLPPSTSTTPSP